MQKRRITTEEYNRLSKEEQKKFQEMHFDENFNPGNGDDIDYTYRIVRAGLKLYEAPFWVDHHRIGEHPISHSDDAEKLKQEHARYFRRKYKLGEFK